LAARWTPVAAPAGVVEETVGALRSSTVSKVTSTQ
jgi:hypothetical protein